MLFYMTFCVGQHLILPKCGPACGDDPISRLHLLKHLRSQPHISQCHDMRSSSPCAAHVSIKHSLHGARTADDPTAHCRQLDSAACAETDILLHDYVGDQQHAAHKCRLPGLRAEQEAVRGRDCCHHLCGALRPCAASWRRLLAVQAPERRQPGWIRAVPGHGSARGQRTLQDRGLVPRCVSPGVTDQGHDP